MTTSRALRACINVSDVRALAKKKVPAPIFHFVDGGAEDEVTMRRNTSAFDTYEIEPEYAIDVGAVDTTTTVFGQSIDWPVFTAPTGGCGLVRMGGELDAVRAVAKSGTIFSQSCMTNVTLEQVAAASSGPKLFQAYVFRDRGITRDLIDRAKAAGFDALCLTFDVPIPGMRERDLRYGLSIPPRLTLQALAQFAKTPAWVLKYLAAPKIGFGNVESYLPADNTDLSTIMKFVTEQYDPTVTWRDAEAFVAQWDGAVAIKGVMTAADAERARDVGATAVMVSNHGGRQLDGAPASVDRLGTVVDAVGDTMEVILDSGIRRGQHVVKALGLGATACMVGRPYVYGMGAGGEAGVSRVLDILRSEVERSMALGGFTSVAEITRERITRRPG